MIYVGGYDDLGLSMEDRHKMEDLIGKVMVIMIIGTRGSLFSDPDG